MTDEILVALDGSRRSRMALPMAIALARAAGARLTLLRVLASPTIAGDTGLGGGAAVVAEAREQVRREAADDLAALAAHIRTEAGVAAEAVFDAGVDAAAVVRAHATSSGARVVVLTTRGAGGAPALGRTAEGVLRGSRVPLLLVPASGEGAAPTRLAAATIARVILPLDGTASPDRVIDLVLTLFGPREVAYTLLVVRPPHAGDEGGAQASESREPSITERARAAAARLVAERGVRVDVVVTTRDDDVVAVIADHATASGADLIAMIARGPTPPGDSPAVGRVTAGVVRASRVPVLVVPAAVGGVPDRGGTPQ